MRYDDAGSPVEVHVVQKTSLLSCDMFRHFWVAFEGGKLEVGTGSSPYVASFFSWTDTAPRAIQGVSFLTTAAGGVGHWQFSRSFCQY
jgi:hypothetical protein